MLLDLFHTFRVVIRAMISFICVMFLLQIPLGFKAYIVCAAVVTDLSELQSLLLCLMFLLQISLSFKAYVVCGTVVTDLFDLQSLCCV